MSSLAETLPALSASLPEIPERLKAVKDAAHEADEAAVELLGEIGARRSRLPELLGQIHDALEELGADTEEDKVGVEAGAAAVEEASTHVASNLEERRTDLGDLIDDVSESVATFQDELRETQRHVEEGAGEGRTGLKEVDDALEAGQGDLTSAVDVAAEELDALQEAVSQAEERLTRETAELADAVRNNLEEGQTRAHETLTRLREMQERLVERIRATAKAVGDEVEGIEREVIKALDAEVEAQVTASLTGVLDDLGELGQTTAQAAAETESQGPIVTQLVSALHEAMGGLPTAIQSVKKAANDVGLPWG